MTRNLSDLLGKSSGIEAIRERITRLLERQQDARRLPPVLIEGETGTGKGLLARLIHRAGPRPDGPFIDVNCAAIPETLLEAEMFGFERGAFTDARRAKPGLFQAANRGTIFLDEVGLLSEGLQAKLLKVLEERSVRRLGSTRDEHVDVWILTATNEDLRTAIRERRFREDLYHRLAVLTLSLPPLRARGDDILLLAEHYLGRACADYGVSAKTLSADARAALRAHAWPGNIRELANLMERVALLSSDPEVTADVLALPGVVSSSTPSAPVAPAAASSLDDAVRDRVIEALRQTSWNISRTAALLGISRNTLRARIEKYGLRPGEEALPAPPPPVQRAERRPARPSPAAPVAAPPTVATPSPPPPAPAPFRWERRRVTLLRAVLLAPSAPETPLETGRSIETFLDKIRSFGGSIEGRSPTGIVAAFGLDPTEDAPSRAAHAAMAILKAGERARQDAGAAPMVKVAIHTSHTLVGQGARQAELDHDGRQAALGVLDALVERAEPDSVLVSDAAATFLRRGFEIVERGSDEVGGRRAFVLAGHERPGLGRGRRPPTFVGRHHELELLRSRLESASRGHGQIVGLTGEAGIGKSRLLFEFRESFATWPAMYVEGHCRSYGSGTPYVPIVDVLRAICGIRDGDAPGMMADRARSSLLEADLDLLETAPYLLHLLDLEHDAQPLATLPPDTMKIRTFETLRQLVLRTSRRTPLVIAIEDLHWIDHTSEEYLDSLAQIVPGARLLLLFTYRGGYRPSWIEKPYVTQVALPPLAPDESVHMVRSLLGPVQNDDGLADLIVAKAEGNPFFVEELALAVREQASLEATAVPDTIQEVLLGRIDRLAVEDRQLLEVAAVVGKDVPHAVVQDVTGTADDALRLAFERLKRADFLYETSPGPETAYTFKHALTHEVAYGRLPGEPRRVLHERIIGAIERLYPARLTDHVERLAHHALRAAAWDKSVVYMRQCGVRALAASAYREAVVCFEQALAALARIPESRATLEQAVELRFDLRTALTPLGEHARIFQHLREARDVAHGLDDPRRVARVEAYLTDYYRLAGDHERARESGERALTIADSLGDLPLQVATNTYLGQVHYDLGLYETGIVYLRRNVERLVGDLVFERLGLPFLSSVHSRVWLMLCLSELGKFAEGVTHGEEARRIAEVVDHPLSLTSVYAALGKLYAVQGDLKRAIPALEHGLQVCRAWNIRLWEPVLRSWLGYASVLDGRVAEGVPLLEEAIAQQVAMGRMASHSARVTALAEAYLAAGRVEEAATLGARAVSLSRERTERGNEAAAFLLLGAVAARTDPPDTERAEACYQRAITLADELAMRPLLARSRLGLGALWRRHGRLEAAGQEIAAARQALTELQMPFWSERAEAEYQALG
jgi:transcriptional regulator with AAA-type ATPase domain/tetratricopeptide (TPR) repeat protein